MLDRDRDMVSSSRPHSDVVSQGGDTWFRVVRGRWAVDSAWVGVFAAVVRTPSFEAVVWDVYGQCWHVRGAGRG